MPSRRSRDEFSFAWREGRPAANKERRSKSKWFKLISLGGEPPPKKGGGNSGFSKGKKRGSSGSSRGTKRGGSGFLPLAFLPQEKDAGGCQQVAVSVVQNGKTTPNIVSLVLETKTQRMRVHRTTASRQCSGYASGTCNLKK